MPAISFEIQMEAEEDTELFQIFPKAFAKAQTVPRSENFALRYSTKIFRFNWELEKFHSFTLSREWQCFIREYARNKSLLDL